MDARERDESQSRRTSSKRPWDGDNSALLGVDGSRMAPVLPPIDAAPSRKLSVPRGAEHGFISRSWYGAEARGPDMERPEAEGHDFSNGSFTRQNIDANRIPPPPLPHDFVSGQLRRPSASPRLSPDKANGPPHSQQSRDLCYRCRGPREQDREFDLGSASCKSCQRDPDLAFVTQAAAAGLTQLVDTLRSGIATEQRSITQGSDAPNLVPADFPPIAQSGLKQTLDWILGSIGHANQLADDFVRNASSRTSQDHTPASGLQDGPANMMKRRHQEDVVGVAKTREDPIKIGSDADLNPQRGRGSSTIGSVKDELPPVRPQHGHRPHMHSSDSYGPRLPVMNPPHVPNRHLPSPPGRSFPSPTSLNFPSSAGPSPSGSSQGANLPTPLSVTHGIDNYLPPLTASRVSDSALRDHAAALQHEVSLQKMALSSLQGEHDNLLAAFSRSQTRASTLEKKHAVSDNEIIDLTEEKLRLQAQVMDLERDVEELSRSRDDFRQASVQEGAQYIEIVNKASRLEELRADETRAWNRTREEMERKIVALTTGDSGENSGRRTASTDITRATITDEMDMETGGLPADVLEGLKIELTDRHTLDEQTPRTSASPPETIESLKREIRRLRERCSQAEKALKEIRDDSRSMEELARAIQSRADAAAAD